MKLKLNNVRVAVTNNKALLDIVAHKLYVDKKNISKITILRRTVDARRKNNICLVYNLALDLALSQEQGAKLLSYHKELTPYKPQAWPELATGTEELTGQPIVVGSGPAGLVAGLILAQAGYKPLILERGKALAQRVTDVENFWRNGNFDPTSNVQFGAGGAGTFSDGKLTTRVNDPVMAHILQCFVEAGAPADILYEHKPHVGTDQLRKMVTCLLQEIERLGGSVRYEAQVTDLRLTGQQVTGVQLASGEVISSNAVILACGHSARDTYAMLDRHKVALEAKAFAIGVRVEHEQKLINQAQYGAMADNPKLGAADYAMVYHDKDRQHTAYSFCMCPGGQVVAAASETGVVVTNGMSQHDRASGLANSALVVNVTPADFGSGVLQGIEFQRHYEQLAYTAGGCDYRAPAQNIKSFMTGSTPTLAAGFTPSYKPGLVASELSKILPPYVVTTLQAGITYFGRRVAGFDQDGILTGVETRTSSPVRILRSESGQSLSHANLYPAGEGAGYAGGIMSAALDGYHQAAKIVARFGK